MCPAHLKWLYYFTKYSSHSSNCFIFHSDHVSSPSQVTLLFYQILKPQFQLFHLSFWPCVQPISSDSTVLPNTQATVPIVSSFILTMCPAHLKWLYCFAKYSSHSSNCFIFQSDLVSSPSHLTLLFCQMLKPQFQLFHLSFWPCVQPISSDSTVLLNTQATVPIVSSFNLTLCPAHLKWLYCFAKYSSHSSNCFIFQSDLVSSPSQVTLLFCQMLKPQFQLFHLSFWPCVQPISSDSTVLPDTQATVPIVSSFILTLCPAHLKWLYCFAKYSSHSSNCFS